MVGNGCTVKVNLNVSTFRDFFQQSSTLPTAYLGSAILVPVYISLCNYFDVYEARSIPLKTEPIITPPPAPSGNEAAVDYSIA